MKTHVGITRDVIDDNNEKRQKTGMVTLEKKKIKS